MFGFIKDAYLLKISTSITNVIIVTIVIDTVTPTIITKIEKQMLCINVQLLTNDQVL